MGCAMSAPPSTPPPPSPPPMPMPMPMPVPLPPPVDGVSAASFASTGDPSRALYGLLKGTSADPALARGGVADVAGLLDVRNMRRAVDDLRDAGGDIPRVKRAVHPADDAVTGATPGAAVGGDALLVLRGVSMSMSYTVLVGKRPAGLDVQGCVAAIFGVIDSCMNGWNCESEIATLNASKPCKKVPISQPLARLFDIVDDVVSITDGRFDPTCGALKVIYRRFLSVKDRPPRPDELVHLKYAVGWKKRVRHDISRSGLATATRNNANTLIDLDGITKGHCVDMIVEALERGGCSDVFVAWAGEIRVAGSHPSGRPWRTAIMSPPDLQRLFQHWGDGTLDAVLSACDAAYFVDLGAATSGCALATSGDYFAIQKYAHHHIIRPDTRTCMRASPSSVGSVTVLASTCAIADGLATAAMTFDTLAEAKVFLEVLRKRMPDVVLGYCVMSRAGGLRERHVCTEKFLPVPQSPSTSNIDSLPSFSEASAVWGSCAVLDRDAAGDEENERLEPKVPSNAYDYSQIMDGVLRKAVRTTGRLRWSDGYGTVGSVPVSWRGGDVEIDSMVWSSMVPRPLLTFFLPSSLSSHAIFSVGEVGYTRDESVREAARPLVKDAVLMYTINPTTTQSPMPVFDDDAGDKVMELVVERILRVASAAFVIARVERVCSKHLAKGETRTNRKTDAVLPAERTAARDDLAGVCLSDPRAGGLLAGRVKQLLKQMAFGVWVLTTKSAEGQWHALTAISVAVSVYAPGLLSFNVKNTSLFSRALCGPGTMVHAHALSGDQSATARKFVRLAVVGDDHSGKDGLLCLRQASTLLIDATVVWKCELQDHVVVVARMRHVEHSADAPWGHLSWLHSRYVAGNKFADVSI